MKASPSLRLCAFALRISALAAAALPALAFYPPQDSRDGVTARFVGFDEKIPADAQFKPSDRKVVLAEKRDAGEPFEIRLDLANTTGEAVEGELRIWIGDDWDVAWATKNNLAQRPQSPQSSNETLCASVPRCETNETSRTSRTSREENAPRPAALALPCSLPPHSTNSVFATAIPKPGRVLPALYPIHATFAFPGGEALHPIAIFEAVADAVPQNLAQRPQSSLSSNETLCASVPRCETNETSRTSRTSRENPDSPIRLAFLDGEAFTQMPGTAPKPIAEESETTGAFFNVGWFAASGDLRYGFFSQPPWRTGGGLLWRDIPVQLPAAANLALCFSAAIRGPLRAGEGHSDGAGYKVFVIAGDGSATQVHSSLVKSLDWQDFVADLSPWAGQAVTLRFLNDCGPKNDPNYDRCLWGDVGVFSDGTARRAAPRSENRENGAPLGNGPGGTGGALGGSVAESFAPGAPSPGRAAPLEMPLSVRGEAWTATIAPGPCGIFDGSIAFSDGERTLSFTGFTCAIDNIQVGPGPLDARCTGFEVQSPGGSVAEPPSFAISHRIDLRDGRTLSARATLRADG
ncbi:MAG: hypothetical protein IJ678_04965, partial [Kiritimatiellae bacterium]|nr:hypothetical protein [Kiritimatiellia bacterium]